ncbi:MULTISPECIES: hypothetical protein [Burkholderia]|uniref:hypothetical protein n=1 Tax=Burkholderia TaxID=32008 RepID=UPI00117D06AA|nr:MULTISPECIES: hypothetical protein [Burkholderia]
MKEFGATQTFAISFVLLLSPPSVSSTAQNNNNYLIFKRKQTSTQKNSNHTSSILESFKFIPTPRVKTRRINHSLTLKTLHLSLFVNLKNAPPINSAHQF